MQNQSMKSKYKVLIAVLTATLLAAGTQASTVKVSDVDGLISVNTVPALGGTDSIAARLGTWNGSTFTAAPTAAGYFDNDLKELSATISASANSTVGINQGSTFALAIFNAPSASSYSSTLAQAVLTDASWIMPLLDFSLTTNNFQLTANTVAQIGSYNFNGGNQLITLAVIPEPSSFSLLLTGLLGLWGATRKRF